MKVKESLSCDALILYGLICSIMDGKISSSCEDTDQWLRAMWMDGFDKAKSLITEMLYESCSDPTGFISTAIKSIGEEEE